MPANTVVPVPGAALVDFRSLLLVSVADWGIAATLALLAVVCAAFAWQRNGAALAMRSVGWALCGFFAASSVAQLLPLAGIFAPALPAMKVLAAGLGLLAAALLLAQPPRLKLLLSAPKMLAALLSSDKSLADAEKLRNRLEAQLQEGAEALRGFRRLFESALRDSPISVTTQDLQLCYTWSHNPFLQKDRQSIIGLTDEDIFPADAAAVVKVIKSHVLKTGESRRGEISVPRDSGLAWYDLTVEPLEDAAGQVVGVITIAVDVTERKASDERLHGLLLEVSHRSKNLLAVVQSLARQTAKQSPSTDAFVERFSARMRSLSHAQDLLVHSDWTAVALQDLLEREFNALGQWGDRVRISGEHLNVRPEAAHSFALALHELASNAVKYGAFSSAGGMVSIDWVVHRDVLQPCVELWWRESGGSPIALPIVSGLGHSILERTIRYGLDGVLSLEFTAEGMQARLELPTRHFADVGGVDALAAHDSQVSGRPTLQRQIK